MDKYEYRVKTEQMMEHMENRQYKKAMEIADTVDWRRVKNASMLSTVSEIYELNGEFQKSRDILLVAYDRSPSSRKIMYRLGILALKLDDPGEASDCYDEFVKLAPKDPNQYILKYKILKAQRSPVSEQIVALSDFKKAEYVEKWAYELARLYDEAGMTAECLEECDDLILWFSEGKYVFQAMELKMKYKPLTPLQQEKYDAYKGEKKTVIRRPEVMHKAQGQEQRLSEEEVVEKLAARETMPLKDLNSIELIDEALESVPSEEEIEADATRRLPTGELNEALKAMQEQKANELSEEESAEETSDVEMTGEEEFDEDDFGATEELPLEAIAEEVSEAEEEPEESIIKKSPISTVIKGVTLEEALAQGVAMANGINRIERKRMEQREEEIRISGQMKIEDILQEWEEKQKVNAEAIEAQKEKDEERLQKEREEIEARKAAEKAEQERKELEEIEKRRAQMQAAEEAARKEAEAKAAEEAARKKVEAKAAAIPSQKKKTPVLSDDIRQLVEELEGRASEEEDDKNFDLGEELEPGQEEPEEEYQIELELIEDEPEEEDDLGEVEEEDEFEEDAYEDDFDEAEEEEEFEEDAYEDDFDEAEEEDEYEEDAYEDDFDEAEEEDEFGEDEYEDDYEDEFEDDYDDELDFDEDEFEEDDFEEDDFDEDDFDEDEFDEDEFEEEELEEDEFEEDVLGEFDEVEFDGEDFFDDELPEIAEPDLDEPLEIEEPSEEEIQERIKKSKGSGVPFDTGFVVTGRYDLSATSEIGLKAGLTEEQKKLFSYFVPVRGMSEQIVEVLDNDRRAQRQGTSRTGNILVFGRKGSGKTVLAVDIVKAIQKQRNLKQGKVAIVTGESLNKKELTNIIQKLKGGAIIIEKAGKLNSRTIKELNLLMEKKTGEMLFVLEDQRKPLERILTAQPEFKKKFTSKLELPVFINDELVTFGQTYAKENGYKLDEMGILALYSRIDVLQREDHAVTVAEVKEIMDEAIDHSQKANVKHLARRMFGKSTDDSDRIILKEEDFKI